MSRSYPLTGLTVLDLSRLYPGAFCSLQLADLGARVIKIEQAGVGDFYRHGPDGPLLGDGVFEALNRGKESLTLDLKSTKGRLILKRLLREADVMIEGFRPGRLRRLGLDYDRLRRLNRRLILCSITGYGQSGPRAQEAGHDLNYIGVAGLLDPEAPVPPPYQVADLAGGGLYASIAILAALQQRERTGRGAWIDMAMAEGVASLMGPGLAQSQCAPRGGRNASDLLGGSAASYRTYKTKDGKNVALAALEPKFWQALQTSTGVDLPGDSGFAPGVFRPVRHRQLQRQFLKRTRRSWLDKNRRDDFCLSPVLSWREVLREPQFVARRFFTTRQLGARRIRMMRSPFVMDRKRLSRSRPAPRLGRDNTAILSELGYSNEEIRRLKKDGIL